MPVINTLGSLSARGFGGQGGSGGGWIGRGFVAVGPNNVLRSQDGISWVVATTPIQRGWRDVTYGNGLFVALGRNGVIVSSDSVNWRVGTIRQNVSWVNVIYGDGRFVAIANLVTFVGISLDGLTWTTSQISSVQRNWHTITYAEGMFVAFADYVNVVATSIDGGMSWTEQALPTTGSPIWDASAYGAGLFVGISASAEVVTSSDGIIWTLEYITTSGIRSVAYGNGLFVGVGGLSQEVTSPDGVTWTDRTLPVTGQTWTDVTYGNGLFVVVGNDWDIYTLTSPDGITWTQHSLPFAIDLQAVAYGDETA